ncbi:hypothetical protein R7Z44_14485 [Vibrio sp. 1409]|uniref:hypothetical protein n=1 Tax=Vibrio sp. 1409 TaxID=3074558 RepID=UPI001CF3B172|nr:hypothetical protein [Vibrio alginolyticus]MDW2258885.1 hypothetical protein [Vibrio sp. 1409]
MIDAVCTYGNTRKTYSILVFQNLSDSEIEKYRQHLKCPECGGQAYYRKKSIDGKAACFGSRYHTEGCNEYRSSPQTELEVKHAIEVDQILLDQNEVVFDFHAKESKTPESKNTLRPQKNKPTSSNTTKSHSLKANHVRKKVLSFEKALNSLLRGSNLAESESLIEIDDGYKYKAKNLFVKLSSAEAAETPKEAKPKMYWGTISHSDTDMEWLNPADCDGIGIPIKRYKSLILKRFNVSEKRDLEGAGLILFGKCFWNAKKTRKIIELWNAERIFISVTDE